MPGILASEAVVDDDGSKGSRSKPFLLQLVWPSGWIKRRRKRVWEARANESLQGEGMLSRQRLILCFWVSVVLLPAWPQRLHSNLDHIKARYLATSAELQVHILHDYNLDADPGSPQLLSEQWSLAGEWVAARLNEDASSGYESVEAAISAIAPKDERPQQVRLTGEAFLVKAPGRLGNVFLVAESDGIYRVVWSTAQPQQSICKSEEGLTGWLPEYAVMGSNPTGPVIEPNFGLVPQDREGRPGFYLVGNYAQKVGGRSYQQISLWSWDDDGVHLLLARTYPVTSDPPTVLQHEDGLLKAQEELTRSCDR
jgi:hypothetical protein